MKIINKNEGEMTNLKSKLRRWEDSAVKDNCRSRKCRFMVMLVVVALIELLIGYFTIILPTKPASFMFS